MKYLNVLFIAPLLFTVWGCAGTPREVVRPQRYILDESVGVGSGKEGFECGWTPTVAETEKALASVYGYMKAELEKDPGNDYLEYIISNWEDYSIQFSGYNRNGLRIIHCNFFLAGSFERDDLDRSPLIVFDGGPAFWNIECDMGSGKCLSLWINGVA